MQNHSADLQLVCNFFNKVLIFFILLVFSLQSGFDAESFCRFTTCVHSVQLLELWKKQARHLARRMCKTHCASKACLNFPFNSLLCIYAELIFVTNITNYICGEKIVIWRYFGKFWEILRNFGNFLEILPQFTRFHVEKNSAQKVYL